MGLLTEVFANEIAASRRGPAPRHLLCRCSSLAKQACCGGWAAAGQLGLRVRHQVQWRW